GRPLDRVQAGGPGGRGAPPRWAHRGPLNPPPGLPPGRILASPPLPLLPLADVPVTCAFAVPLADLEVFPGGPQLLCSGRAYHLVEQFPADPAPGLHQDGFAIAITDVESQGAVQGVPYPSPRVAVRCVDRVVAASPQEAPGPGPGPD